MSAEKDVIKTILELYKDMPYLWNKSNPNYINKNIRHQGLNILLKVYKNIDNSATIKTITKKLNNLKANYLRESKKVKTSKHSGAGTDDLYQPSIWYYNYLTFLESTTTPCRSVRDTLEENSSLSSTEDELRRPTTSGLKKKKKTSQKEILEKASELLNSSEQSWEIVGKSIGLQLKDIVNPQQNIIARKLISDIIFYGNMNKLSEFTIIDLRADFSSNVSNCKEKNRNSISPSIHSKSSFSNDLQPTFSSFPLQHQPTPISLQQTSPQYTIQSPNSPHYLTSPTHEHNSQASQETTHLSEHQYSSRTSPQFDIQPQGIPNHPIPNTHQFRYHTSPQYQNHLQEPSHFSALSAHQHSSHTSHYHAQTSSTPNLSTLNLPTPNRPKAIQHSLITQNTHQHRLHSSPQCHIQSPPHPFSPTSSTHQYYSSSSQYRTQTDTSHKITPLTHHTPQIHSDVYQMSSPNASPNETNIVLSGKAKDLILLGKK